LVHQHSPSLEGEQHRPAQARHLRVRRHHEEAAKGRLIAAAPLDADDRDLNKVEI
jgi:hypothetical protein